MTRIRVAVGVVFNDKGHILIAKRSSQQHQGGLWEFPGGKIEAHESAETALARELYEEVGIQVLQCHFFTRVQFDYKDKQVCLEVFKVPAFAGVPSSCENQPLQWIEPQRLTEYAFPPANEDIITALLA